MLESDFNRKEASNDRISGRLIQAVAEIGCSLRVFVVMVQFCGRGSLVEE